MLLYFKAEETSSAKRLGHGDDFFLVGGKMLCAREAERQSDSCP